MDNIETYKYTIDEAIKNHYLSHYEYYPIFVNLTENEFHSFQVFTKQVIIAKDQEPVDEMAVKDILTKRSRVVKKSSSKLSKLSSMVKGEDGCNYIFKNSVVYCGQGKDYETEGSIIDPQYLSLSKSIANNSLSKKTIKERYIELCNGTPIVFSTAE